MFAGMAREHHGRRGRRSEAAENAKHRRAVPGADDAQGEVAGQRQAGNEHHHPPDLARVDRVVGPEILARQDGQDDEGENGELQDGVDVLRRRPLAQLLELGLEIEQHGGRDGQHDGQRRVAEPDCRTEAVGHDDSRFRREAAVLLLLLRREIGGDHRPGNDQQANGEQPGATGALVEQGEQAAQHGDQREGAQAGRRVGPPLAFHADQQPDAQGRGEGLDRFNQFRNHEAHAPPQF